MRFFKFILSVVIYDCRRPYTFLCEVITLIVLLLRMVFAEYFSCSKTKSLSVCVGRHWPALLITGPKKKQRSAKEQKLVDDHVMNVNVSAALEKMKQDGVRCSASQMPAAPHYCRCGHRGPLCAACTEGLVKQQNGICCNPVPAKGFSILKPFMGYALMTAWLLRTACEVDQSASPGIMIFFVQTLQLVGKDLGWAQGLPYVQELIDFLIDLANFEFENHGNTHAVGIPDCDFAYTAISSFYKTTIWQPLYMMFCTGVVFLVWNSVGKLLWNTVQRCRQRCCRRPGAAIADSDDNRTEETPDREAAGWKHVLSSVELSRAYLLLFVFMYMPIVKACLGMLIPREFSGAQYLNADMSVLFWGDQHVMAFLVAIMYMVVCLIGAPSFFVHVGMQNEFQMTVQLKDVDDNIKSDKEFKHMVYIVLYGKYLTGHGRSKHAASGAANMRASGQRRRQHATLNDKYPDSKYGYYYWECLRKVSLPRSLEPSEDWLFVPCCVFRAFVSLANAPSQRERGPPSNKPNAD